MKTFYAVTVKYGDKRYYAVRGRQPQVIYPPEPRCLFKKEGIARELKRFLDRESTFHDVRIDSVDI